MIYNNKYLIAIFLSLFMVQPVINIYGAKESTKNSKSSPKQAGNSSSNAEVYVFPADTEKQPFKPVKRVITGIFSNKQQKKALEDQKSKEKGNEVIQPRPVAPRTLNAKTIAWTTPMGIYYHDPNNNCSNANERNWAEENKELVGLEPCPDCFKRSFKIPEFIKKQFGNIEIADSEHLLLNNEFIEWAKTRLPVKDMNFISGDKLLAYPSLDMSSLGMHQLATELEKAYLKQTWRVIEVQVKSNPNVVEYVSSFHPTAELLGVVKNKETENKTSTQSAKSSKKPNTHK